MSPRIHPPDTLTTLSMTACNSWTHLLISEDHCTICAQKQWEERLTKWEMYPNNRKSQEKPSGNFTLSLSPPSKCIPVISKNDWERSVSVLPKCFFSGQYYYSSAFIKCHLISKHQFEPILSTLKDKSSTHRQMCPNSINPWSPTFFRWGAALPSLATFGSRHGLGLGAQSICLHR